MHNSGCEGLGKKKPRGRCSIFVRIEMIIDVFQLEINEIFFKILIRLITLLRTIYQDIYRYTYSKLLIYSLFRTRIRFWFVLLDLLHTLLSDTLMLGGIPRSFVISAGWLKHGVSFRLHRALSEKYYTVEREGLLLISTIYFC